MSVCLSSARAHTEPPLVLIFSRVSDVTAARRHCRDGAQHIYRATQARARCIEKLRATRPPIYRALQSLAVRWLDVLCRYIYAPAQVCTCGRAQKRIGEKEERTRYYTDERARRRRGINSRRRRRRLRARSRGQG